MDLIGARNEAFGDLEDGDRAGDVQNLEARKDQDIDASGHGGKRGKNVISAIVDSWHNLRRQPPGSGETP